MAKFSIGKLEDDGEGPSSRDSNIQRLQTDLREELSEQEQEEETNEVDEYNEEFQFFPSDEDEERVEDEEERVNNDGKGETVGTSENGPFSVIIKHPEIFDCPICCEPLTIPVFQCENGHIACSTCCIKVMNKCPSCCTPIGYNRCRAYERVLESVKVTCRNTKYGCKETISYDKKHDHDKTCRHSPCSCPIPDCSFVGSANHLYKHFSAKHENSSVHFSYNAVVWVTLNVNNRFIVLQEEEDGVLFILNNRAESLGHVISVSCIAPSWKGRSYYDILARPARSMVRIPPLWWKERSAYDFLAGPSGSMVRFQSVTENIQIRVENPPSTGFLLVPFELFGSSGDLKLGVCIRHPVMSA